LANRSRLGRGAPSNGSLQHAWYEQQLRHYHDKNIQQRDFNVGNLVLRRVQSPGGKLTSPWEGPFIVSSVVVPGTYRLQREDGTDVGNPWNIEHLRHFYPQKNDKESYVFNSLVINKVQSFSVTCTCFFFFSPTCSAHSGAARRSARLACDTRGMGSASPIRPSLLSADTPNATSCCEHNPASLGTTLHHLLPLAHLMTSSQLGK